MAHSTMHFAVGLAVGTALLLPPILRKLKAGAKTAGATGKLLCGSYALAAFAVIPNILRHSGLSDTFCSGWWMNLFLFNPLIDKLKAGGTLIGEISIILLFVIHYSITLAGIVKAARGSGKTANDVFVGRIKRID